MLPPAELVLLEWNNEGSTIMNRKQRRLSVIMAGWVLFTLSGPGKAVTITVGPSDQYNFRTIQSALNAARVGDLVLVADGVYTDEGNRDIKFSCGGVVLQSEGGAAGCIINCQRLGSAFRLDRSASGCVVDGFTIIGGLSEAGGAISISGSRSQAPLIKNCVFEDNEASKNDGGAILMGSGDAVCLNCTFIDCRANDDGGAISVQEGGDMWLIGCAFHANRSGDNGGALFGRQANLSLLYCRFLENEAQSNGAAIYNRQSSFQIINCLFNGNRARVSGGALYNRDAHSPVLLACTLTHNSAGLEGGAVANAAGQGFSSLVDCIVWDNRVAVPGTGQDQISGNLPTVQHCCIQGWVDPGGDMGNISDDPLFVDAEGPDGTPGTDDDDLRLLPASPCRDAGRLRYVSHPLTWDLDGAPRLRGDVIDMGAYEFTPADGNTHVAMVEVLQDWIPEPIVINEIMAHSPNGSDWIELHNVTDTALDLSDWQLSDRTYPSWAFNIPRGTIIEPNGYLLFRQGNIDPETEFMFGLQAGGERIYLYSALDGIRTGYRHRVSYPASTSDASLIRHRNSVGLLEYVQAGEATPGWTNATPAVGPLVISEVMYDSDHSTEAEYIEFKNIGPLPLELAPALNGRSWRLDLSSGRIDIPDSLRTQIIPTIVPGGTLLLVWDRDLFDTQYGPIPDTCVVIEPIKANEIHWLHGRVDVLMPEPDASTHVTLDRLEYGSSHAALCSDPDSIWPLEARHRDRSLTRITLDAYGNDPNNWQAASPTPGY